MSPPLGNYQRVVHHDVAGEHRSLWFLSNGWKGHLNNNILIIYNVHWCVIAKTSWFYAHFAPGPYREDYLTIGFNL